MKRAILISAIVLAIILIFVKDVLIYLGLSILMALIVWLIGKTSGYRTKEAILSILAAAVILPIIMIALFGMIRMQLHPEAVNEISANTVEQIINYFAKNIVYIVLADFAGVLAGAIIQASRGK